MKDKLSKLFNEHEISYAEYLNNKKYNTQRLGSAMYLLWMSLIVSLGGVFSESGTLLHTIMAFLIPFCYFTSIFSLHFLGQMERTLEKTWIIIARSAAHAISLSIIYYFVIGLILPNSNIIMEHADGSFSLSLYSDLPAILMGFPILLGFSFYLNHMTKKNAAYEKGKETQRLSKVQNEIKLSCKSIEDTLSFIEICKEKHFDKTFTILNMILEEQVKKEGFNSLDEYQKDHEEKLKTKKEKNRNNVYSF